jgi:hypothetical protein
MQPCSYEPGPAFQESGEEDTLEISPSDSTELWLIQWPINHVKLCGMLLVCCIWGSLVTCFSVITQVDASDFHGNEVSLKLHKDGNLGNLECSSGKINVMYYVQNCVPLLFTCFSHLKISQNSATTEFAFGEFCHASAMIDPIFSQVCFYF